MNALRSPVIQSRLKALMNEDSTKSRFDSVMATLAKSGRKLASPLAVSTPSPTLGNQKLASQLPPSPTAQTGPSKPPQSLRPVGRYSKVLPTPRAAMLRRRINQGGPCSETPSQPDAPMSPTGASGHGSSQWPSEGGRSAGYCVGNERAKADKDAHGYSSRSASSPDAVSPVGLAEAAGAVEPPSCLDSMVPAPFESSTAEQRERYWQQVLKEEEDFDFDFISTRGSSPLTFTATLEDDPLVKKSGKGHGQRPAMAVIGETRASDTPDVDEHIYGLSGWYFLPPSHQREFPVFEDRII